MDAFVDVADHSGDVLVIGRESEAAKMYRMKLQLDGYGVIAVDDLGAAPAHAAGWRPDLVLIDLGAAGGVQLLELLRGDPFLAGVPRLLLSTRSEDELLRQGVTLGPIDYVLRSV